MGLLGNVVSNQLEKRQNVTSQAVQLQNYCTEHEQELKEGCEGGHFVMLDSNDVWGEFIMIPDRKSIAKRLGMDSDGWFTIMANHTEFIMHFEETAGIVVRGYKGSSYGSSSGLSSNSWDDDEDDEDNESRREQKRQAREQRNSERKEEEEKARGIVNQIDELPIDGTNITQQIKDCILRASRNTFSTKLANQMVKDAWKAREKRLREYADTNFKEDPAYIKLLAEEEAKRIEEEKQNAERKAIAEAKKAEEEKLRKEREEKEAKEEAHFKKVNRICWLTWLGLTVFFLIADELDIFWYEWYHYVLVVLVSIIIAVILIVRMLAH